MKKMQMKKISLLTSIVMLLGTAPSLNVSAAAALSWIVEPTLVCDEVYFDSEIGWLGYNITGYDEDWGYGYGKHGIVGEDGSVILPLEYDYMISIGHNLVRVTQENNVKIYDTKGNAAVQFEKYNYNCYGLWGAEDSDYLVTSSSEVNAWLEGLANTAGDEILPQEYDYFVNMDMEKNRISASKNGKCGITDISGNEIVPFQYYNISMLEDTVVVMGDNGYGLIDYNNNQLIPCEYERLYAFDEDEQLFFANKGGKTGVIDRSNNIIIPLEYNHLYEMNEYENLFDAVKENKTGAIDSENNVIIPFEYSMVSPVHRTAQDEKLMIVAKDNKCGVINYNNETVIDFDYGYLSSCMIDSSVSVLCANKGDKYGVIDYSGNTLIPFEYDSFYFGFDCDYLILEKDNELYMVSSDNFKLIPLGADDFYSVGKYNEQGYFCIINNGKYGIANEKGTVTIQPQYDSINIVDNTDLCVVEKDNKKGLLNYVSGEELISPQYDGLSVKAEGDDITLAVKDDSGKWGFAKLDISDDPDDCIILRIDSKAAKCYGKQIINDVAPVIRNERTMLPSRFIAEALGASVEWNPEERKVTITGDNVTIILTIDSDKAYVNGEEETLDSPAFIENDRTYTPVRFICEKLGASVDWDAQSKKVIIK